MDRLAIIGASTGQIPLLLKAKELGIYTICFAWEEGAVGKDIPDKFFPVSIYDYSEIIEICKKENIRGITSNGSDKTALSVSYLATALKLNGLNYDRLLEIKNKSYVREITNNIPGLTPIPFFSLEKFLDTYPNDYPYIVKPNNGGGKKGVQFIKSEEDIEKAVTYANSSADSSGLLIEKCVDGIEISVETISYHNKHYLLQVTDKVNSGPPHFVELEHHQPSNIPSCIKERLSGIIQDMLTKLGVDDCACHIEFKINGDDLYLIEINPRGGGDEISGQLIQLSTGFDFAKALIDIALNKFDPASIRDDGNASGIYFLCSQSERIKKYFDIQDHELPEWFVKRQLTDPKLREGTTNYDRNGYIIYKSDKRVIL